MMKSNFWGVFYAATFSIGMLLSASSNATTVNYTLDNVFLGTTTQMTGTFEWVYDADDFEGGTGKFLELSIPNTSWAINDINISFDAKKSIEFTLKQNLDNDGLDINLVFMSPLAPTQSTLLDLSASKWSIGARGLPA